jgi:tRNA1(Val) A37 N6-methylase TrmN6
MNYTNDNIFDKIIMNPPYEKLQDLKHTLKAYELLNE